MTFFLLFPLWDAACGATSDPVIVVGAGLSGLGAALELAEQGFGDVTVLEARNRTGGRTFTDYSLGASAEMGAGWVHGLQNNPVYERCTDAGIDVKQFTWEDSDLWDENGVIMPKSVISELKDDMETLEQVVETWADEQAQPAPRLAAFFHRRRAWPACAPGQARIKSARTAPHGSPRVPFSTHAHRGRTPTQH
jgi:monoamine oxidase